MFQIVKRGDITTLRKTCNMLLAILLALAAVAIFLAVLGYNPLSVYISMLDGAFGSSYRFKQTIVNMVPLVITSLGILIAFKMKFWNIGAEGQILIGGFCGSFFAYNFSSWPKPILLIVMLLAGFIGGGLWGLIAGYLKARWHASEAITTLMMNYIALKWIVYLQFGPWKDPAAFGYPTMSRFAVSAILPKLFGVNIGWVIALLLVVIVHIFMTRTKKGFEIAVLGESENTGRYAGISIKRTMLLAIFLSGALCGLSGIIQASAVNNILSSSLANGLGYTAIITTWLAHLSAPLTLVVCFLFAVLAQGGNFIQTAVGIPSAVATVLQAVILFFVLGSELFNNYKIVRRNNKGEAEKK